MTDIPKPIQDWMEQLSLLYNIPFAYLLPHEKCLPMESIMFFFIDPNWVSALIDGALSIGRTTAQDALIDSDALPVFIDSANKTAYKVRHNKMHIRHKRNNTPNRPMTGFFLRSDIVDHWRGIEIKGYNKNSQLTILRMEVIGSKILICIFDGKIDKVELVEPMELIHFGTRANDRKIKVKNLKEGPDFGKPLENIEITVRTNKNGRFDVAGLVQELGEIKNIGSDTIGPCELAFEMLSVAERAEFKAHMSSERKTIK